MDVSIFLLLILTMVVDAARILAIFPIPSISHQVVFREYTQELARRGHELVIITPNPALSKVRPPDNITEIDVGFVYQLLKNVYPKYRNKYKRGIVAHSMFQSSDFLEDLLLVLIEEFKIPEIRRIIDNNEKFDLIIFESFFAYPLVFSQFMQAPVIQISSLYGTAENMEAVGAISRHPLYFPNIWRCEFGGSSLWEKLYGVYTEIILMRNYYKVQHFENNLLAKHFGGNIQTVHSLMNNVDLLFLNSHPILDNNRPVPPNVVYLGALHLKPVQKLPKDLNTYLNQSRRGVIYVSLGTNIQPSRMDIKFLEVFINAFASLPYEILWKFDGDNLKNKPQNLKIEKWFPQRDLLTHPNIKAFVTQGGLQSTDEAIDAGVPLIGIPLVADQCHNVNKYVELGIGIKLNPVTLTAEELANAIKTIAEGISYRKNIQKIKSIIQDQPERPLDRAIWWTEYVIRHGGAKHLRSSAANKSWAEYLMLDVVAFVAILIIITLIFFIIITHHIIKCIFNILGRNENKLKIK